MIIANVASYPLRESSLQKTIERLSPQVTLLNVVLNEYPELPDWTAPRNVRLIIPERDLKDCGKFLPRPHPDDIVFLADDDILYPPDYVEHTVTWLRRMPSDRYVVGYHGSVYRPMIPKPPLLDRAQIFLGLKSVPISRSVTYFKLGLESPTLVDQLGTGVLATWGRNVPPFEYMETSQKFVDVRMARWCFSNDISNVCIPRGQDWLMPVDHDETIYRGFTLSAPPNVDLEIRSFSLKRPDVGKIICARESA